MVYIACGVNHKTAPLRIREQCVVPVHQQEAVLTLLNQHPAIHEVAMLNTCNRTELYCDTSDPDIVLPVFFDACKASNHDMRAHMYRHLNHHAITHTLRVASGLDSLMLGETQILGQMKQAFHQACNLGTAKHQLRALFQYVFRASKRIRTHSGVGKNPISVASSAVSQLKQFLPNLASSTALIIGSGDTGSLVAKYLKQANMQSLWIASRTTAHATQLAESLNASVMEITQLEKQLPHMDVVIAATTCPVPFIHVEMVQRALKERNQRPMIFIDLAVPRNIEPEVGSLDHVRLINVDDLESMVQEGLRERQIAASEAENLIQMELNNYIRWHRTVQTKEQICDYREHMQTLAQHEVERALSKIQHGHETSEIVHELAFRLVNKLTHHASVGIRRAAWEGRRDLLDLTERLFNTKDNVSTEKSTS